MYVDHVEEAPSLSVLVFAVFPFLCFMHGMRSSTETQAHGAQPKSCEPLIRSTLSVPLLPSQRLFRHSGVPAVDWPSCSSSDSQLQMTGCMPITLLKGSVLSLGDEHVSGCLTESARCHAQMSHERSAPKQEMGHVCGPYTGSTLSGMSMEPPFQEGSAGQDFRCLQALS